MPPFADVITPIRSIRYYVTHIEIDFAVPVSHQLVCENTFIGFKTADSRRAICTMAFSFLVISGQSGEIDNLKLNYPADERITAGTVKAARVHFRVGKKSCLVRWFH